MKEKLLKTPQGAESIFLDEAYKHEKINEAINDIYTKWGYLPIKTPVFDYYETYEKLLSDTSKKNCFRLMDRDGELLLLRNDITLFLARQLGRVLKEEDKVLRVHYSDSILRHQSEIDISSNEFFQTGAELVGASGLYGDLETITLLLSIIEDLKIPATKIHLGSRAIFDKVIGTLNINETETLIELINSRDYTSLMNYISKYSDTEMSKSITDLFLFIGKYDEYIDYVNNNKDFIKKIDIVNETSYLLEIGKNLQEIEKIDSIRFDLSEVANRDYYTGIVFKAYTQDIDSAIASGGRYDNLINSFGNSIPSVGFSILLRKVENKIDDNRFYTPEIETINATSSYKDAYLQAQKLRTSGKSSIIQEVK